MRWTCAAGLALTGLSLAASPATGASPSEPRPELRFTVEGSYSPLTARPDCWFFITAACGVRWTGTGRFTGDLDGTLEYARRAFSLPPYSTQYADNLYEYRMEYRFVGRVAGCGQGILDLGGLGWWTKADPARARFSGRESLGVNGATGGLAGAGGVFHGESEMGLDGTLRAEYRGPLGCPSKEVVQGAPRRRALRVGRPCTPRKQRLYRRHGFTCRKRAGGRHRLARARSGP